MRVYVLIVACIALAFAACDGGNRSRTPGASTPISAATPGPPDPRFTPIAGARALSGMEGGAAYRIEVPAAWNGDLVLYARPFNPDGRLILVDPPNRASLVSAGYAWAASSLSTPAFLPGTAATETLALRDVFVREVGAPSRTYIEGSSMGGGAAAIVAERPDSHIDGALATCAVAGSRAHTGYATDLLLAGAVAAGLAQPDLDRSSTSALVENTIRPSLDDPARREAFYDSVIQATGGARPFDVEGIASAYASNWAFVEALGDAGLLDSSAASIAVGGLTVRPSRQAPSATQQDVGGNLVIPLLTLHDTGDGVVPLSEAREIRMKADVAGRGGLLVQRTVQSADHCDFTPKEIDDAFTSLVSWVAQGLKPSGEDLLSADLTSLGAAFTDTDGRFGRP